MWRQNDKDHAKWEETQCLTFFVVCSQERIKGNNVKKREPAYEAVHSAKDCEGDDSPFYRQQSLNSTHSHLHLGGVQYSCSHKKADDWTAMTLPSLIFNQIFCRCRRLSHRHRHRGMCSVLCATGWYLNNLLTLYFTFSEVMVSFETVEMVTSSLFYRITVSF